MVMTGQHKASVGICDPIIPGALFSLQKWSRLMSRDNLTSSFLGWTPRGGKV